MTTSVSSGPRLAPVAQYAHKIDSANVWIAPLTLTADEAVFSYRIPHSGGGVRIADLVEVERQAGMYFLHTAFGVPPTDVFILNSISITLAGSDAGPADRCGKIIVRAAELEVKGIRLRSASLQFKLGSAAALAGGTASVQFLSEATYARVRRLSRPQQSLPRVPDLPRVGATHVASVPLTVDHRDPMLNDHTNDHFPAMSVVLETERLLSTTVATSRVVDLHATFSSFIDVQSAPTLDLVTGPPNRFHAAALQGATRCALVKGSYATAPWRTQGDPHA